MTTNEHLSKGLPVNLFLAGRPCLVVGGGKVAWRKIQLLLEAGAEVAAVSPEVCPEVGELIEQGLITHTVRPFEAHDIDDATLVYAAANSRGVNRNVLECCREKGILCCCVDGNWSKSDFTTPAITRYNQLTLSVSSGGNDCRQSKMVKNSLARHLKMMEAANLVIVGTDHNHLTVEEREPYHLTGPRFERGGFMIMQLWGIHEFMILNTCNRVEVIAVVSDETEKNGILRHVMGFTALKEDKFEIYTQPIISLSGAGQGGPAVEVLLRLRDDNNNIVLPKQFIQAAERYQLMASVDRWMVQATLAAIGQGALRLPEGRSCSINISGQTLSEGSFLEFVVDCLDHSQVNPGQICFEVSEFTAKNNTENAALPA